MNRHLFDRELRCQFDESNGIVDMKKGQDRSELPLLIVVNADAVENEISRMPADLRIEVIGKIRKVTDGCAVSMSEERRVIDQRLVVEDRVSLELH